MTPSHPSLHAVRCRLQALAWHVLARLEGTPTDAINVVAATEDVVLTLTFCPRGHPADPDGTMPPNFLSPLELSILQALSNKCLKAAAIGRRTGHTDSTNQANPLLRDVLRNLEERGIVHHADEGYQVAPEFADRARRWIAAP